MADLHNHNDVPELPESPCQSPKEEPYSQFKSICNASYSLMHLSNAEYRDFDGSIESLRRPPLTKEQVDTLEAFFQAQPKVDNMAKFRFGLQSKLTLPRVIVRSASKITSMSRS